MSKIDLLFLAAYGAIVSLIVSFVLQGPIFGFREYAISFLIAIGSWYAGTSLIASFSGTEVRVEANFQRRMWQWTFFSALGLTLICIVYPITVLAGRTSYPMPLLIMHFAVIFLTGTLARSMSFAASRAVKSRVLAIERARKAAATRVTKVDRGSVK